MPVQIIHPHCGEGDWRDGATLSPRSEMEELLDAHFEDVTPTLLALEAHHCRTAHLDVVDSCPARRFFEGGKP